MRDRVLEWVLGCPPACLPALANHDHALKSIAKTGFNFEGLPQSISQQAAEQNPQYSHYCPRKSAGLGEQMSVSLSVCLLLF